MSKANDAKQKIEDAAEKVKAAAEDTRKNLQGKADEAVKNLQASADQAGDLAKNIWLAGLGAYGKAVDDAVERYETAVTASQDTSKLFDELVAKGEEIEGKAKKSFEELRESASVEDRIAEMRDRLGFDQIANIADFGRLEEKMDALAKKLDSLSWGAKPKAAAPAKKAPAKKKAAAKKAPAKKKAAAKKAPAKKAAAKKAAAKKAPAKKAAAKKAPAKKAAAKKAAAKK